MTSSQKAQRLAKIDRLELKIKAAVAEIEKEEKVKIEFKGGRYDSVSYTPKIVITEIADTKEVRNLHTRKNLNLSLSKGFVGNIIGLTYDGMTIKEIKTRSPKYPIIYEKGGKSYKASVSFMKSRIPEKAITRYNNLKELLED